MDFDLRCLDFDIFRRVVFDEAAVTKAVAEKFWREIIGINEPSSERYEADKNATCVAFFSFVRPQWLMPKSLFNEGTLWRTISVSLEEAGAGVWKSFGEVCFIHCTFHLPLSASSPLSLAQDGKL